jgi:sulfur carrier protein
MTSSTYFFLNGQEYFTYSDISILEVINYFNYNSALLVLEYNNLICNQNHWHQVSVQNNDKLEIVTIVGGG